MADDDPLMGYKSDPLMGYKSPKPEIAQPTDSLPPLDPRTATTGDYLARLHQAAGGLGQMIGKIPDYARVAGNTFDVYDKMAAGARTGGFVQDKDGNYVAANDPDAEAKALAEERAKTTAAGENIGLAGRFAANMTGSLPFAALGIGGAVGRVAESAVPRYVAQIFGRGVEGGTMGGTSAASRDENVGWGTLLGSLWGMGSAALGGRGRGEVPKATDPAVLKTNEDATTQEMGNVKFNSGHIATAYDDARNGLAQHQRDNLSYPMRMKVAQQQAGNASAPTTSADTINGYARNIFDGAKNKDDRVYAAKISEYLLDKLAKARPTSNHPVGYGAQLNDRVNLERAAMGDAKWLGGTDITKAPAEASAKLEDPRMLYTPAGKDAVSTLASFAPKPVLPTTNQAVGAFQGVTNAVGKTVGNKIGSATLATLFGHPYVGGALIALRGAGGAATGALEANRNARILRAIDAAKVATSTQRPTTINDMLPPAPIRNVYSGVLASQAANPDYRNRIAPPYSP